jgi:hypothetical protein
MNRLDGKTCLFGGLDPRGGQLFVLLPCQVKDASSAPCC